ncbi:hypothetical protein PENTCL1PPCAC_25562, partial [Pristionchus entomophagus]
SQAECTLRIAGAEFLFLSTVRASAIKSTVDTAINSHRKCLEYAKELAAYRKEEREEVNLAFRKLLIAAEHTDFLAGERLNAKFSEVDLSLYSAVPIGSGGEGSIFRCDLPGSIISSCDETVTVVCKKFESGDVARGNNEIRSLSDLRHPNVVQLL